MASASVVIDGRFELVERLGSGGMGTVWRARDLALERDVALKEVRLAGQEQPAEDSTRAQMMRDRVMREARALARLDHPNVVTIHHIVDSPGMPHPWIVMELVRGRSLADRLATGTLAPSEAALIGRGILAALRAAHAADILHRDVKPANVLLRGDGSPVLTDFGIAALRESTRVTATGGLVGSPEYIAPERLDGQEGNPASDFWSLGMLLYVAVDGRHPMRRDSPVATLAAVMKGVVPPPRQAGPLTPVLRALLVPDPAARPTAEALDHMLAQAAGQISTMIAFPPPAAVSPAPAPPIPVPASLPPRFPPPGPHTMPPAPHTMPPAGNSLPGTIPPPGPVRRDGGRTGAVIGIAVASTVTVIAAVAAFVLPKVLAEGGGGTGGTGGGARAGAGPTASADSTAGAGGPGARTTQSGSLLTPARIRSVIAALEKVTGGVEFSGFTLFDEYAVAEAPVRGHPNLYDRFSYRDGQASRTGAGGTFSAGDATVRLRSIRWDAIPALLRTAGRTLRVPKPTSRYLIVQPSWPFANNRPVILVYLTDDYGGAYLAADVKGKVLRTVPRDR